MSFNKLNAEQKSVINANIFFQKLLKIDLYKTDVVDFIIDNEDDFEEFLEIIQALESYEFIASLCNSIIQVRYVTYIFDKLKNELDKLVLDDEFINYNESSRDLIFNLYYTDSLFPDLQELEDTYYDIHED